jgi:rubredoxin
MVTPGDVTCPKCGEDRPTLITEVVDPMPHRYFCSVCAHEFKVQKSVPVAARPTAAT